MDQQQKNCKPPVMKTATNSEAISPGLAVEMTSVEKSTHRAKEPRHYELTIEGTFEFLKAVHNFLLALRSGGLFGKSKMGLQDGDLVGNSSQRSGKSNRSASEKIASKGTRTPETTPKALKSTDIPGKNLKMTLTPENRVRTPVDSLETAKTSRTAIERSSKATFTPESTFIGLMTPIQCLKTSETNTPSSLSLASTSFGSPKTPQGTAVPPNTPATRMASMNTAITPNGLSCKTANTIQETPKTSKTTIRRTARQSLFPKLIIQETKNDRSRKSEKSKSRSTVKVNTTRNTTCSSTSQGSVGASTANSCATGKSFDLPGTPRTCTEVPPPVLAEAKAEQNKIVITSSTPDKSFHVCVLS